METSLNRNEKLIALFAVGGTLVFFSLFLNINKNPVASLANLNARSQINYQMARPEENFSEYSLNGREVDQVYEAVRKKEIAKSLAAAKPLSEADKKAVNIKKLADTKNKSLAQSQAQQSAQRAAQQTEQARKSFDGQSRNLKSVASQTTEVSHNNTDSISADAQNNAEQKSPAPQNQVLTKPKKSFADWRNQIFAQPTRESLNLFLEAFRKGEVTSTEVQSLSQDLIDQNDEKLKGLGLYALRATPSLASLSQLVHVEAQVSAGLKTYIDQAYLSYLQPQNVGYLNQALQTKDKTLILKSLNLLGVNLQKLTKGDFSTLVDSRNRRDSDATAGITMDLYKGLIPALTALGTSQDQELAPLAQQVASFIQSTNNVASN